MRACAWLPSPVSLKSFRVRRKKPEVVTILLLEQTSHFEGRNAIIFQNKTPLNVNYVVRKGYSRWRSRPGCFRPLRSEAGWIFQIGWSCCCTRFWHFRTLPWWDCRGGKHFDVVPSASQRQGRVCFCITCSARWPAPPGCSSPTGTSRPSSGSSPTRTEATAWCSQSSPPPIPHWSGQTPECSAIQLNTPWPSVTFPYLRTHSLLCFDGFREIVLAPGSISIRSRGKLRCNKA